MKIHEAYGGGSAQSFNAVAPLFYPVSGFDSVIADDGGKPVVVKKMLHGATHIFSTATDLPLELYAALFREAGVHRYTDHADDPVWVGNDVLFLHVAVGGRKALLLPDGCRARAIIGPHKGVVQSLEPWEGIPGMTYGFLIEK